jgi:hypothetical protein
MLPIDEVNNMTELKCVSCDEQLKDNDDHYVTEDGRKVCSSCYEQADPIATVVYGDGRPDDRVTEYENETDFKIGYHHSDGWRGYYEVVESDGWTNVHDDCILGGSDDAQDLADFTDKLERFCNDKEIGYAKVYCRTSNVFSSGMDFFVETAKADEVAKCVKRLLKKHRDPASFNSTALTGADPEDQTREDKQFVMAAGLMQAGSSPEDAVKTVKALQAMQDLIAGKG